MAERQEIRKVIFDDGSVAEYDGKDLTLTDANDSASVPLEGGGLAELLWLLTKRRSRAGRTAPKPRPAAKPKPVDTPIPPAA